jgi:hypothetical protein
VELSSSHMSVKYQLPVGKNGLFAAFIEPRPKLQRVSDKKNWPLRLSRIVI